MSKANQAVTLAQRTCKNSHYLTILFVYLFVLQSEAAAAAQVLLSGESEPSRRMADCILSRWECC